MGAVHRRAAPGLLTALLVLAPSCSSDSGSTSTMTGEDAGDRPTSTSTVDQPAPTDRTATDLQRFPDVIAVEVATTGEGTARFDVTVSSPYDSPERYADAWRIVGPDGTEYGVRELAHDHAGEQPFTRSLDGVAIPEGVESVTVEARDSEYGWGGATVEVAP